MKLSIITINLNNSNGLKDTIISVIRQTYSDLQFIVIDGGSTDGSVDVINKYEKHIEFWVSEMDDGIFNAMNKGIRKATGDYLLFLNSGDYLFSGNVIEQVFRNNHDEDLLYGRQLRIKKSASEIIDFPRTLTFYHFFTGFIAHNCTFIKRQLFNIVGFYDERYKIASDWEFFVLAVCKFNCTTTYLNYTISTMVEGGISNNPTFKEIVKSERERILKAHFPRFVDDYQVLYNLRYNTWSKRLKRVLKKLLSKSSEK